MKILVTGGAGFVGSHLCDRLVADGHEVIALDNLSTGSEQNVAHHDAGRFRLLRQDVAEPFHPALVVDWIYNLACPASPVDYQRDPIHTLETCVFGVVNCLELAERTGARMLQASTSEVYGDPQVHPQVEDYWGHVNPIGLRSCYDEGKRAGEAFCFSYRRERDVDVRVARIFNTYGPRMQADDGRVVSNFVVQALAGEPLTIYGDGQQTRSFCYVDDTVEGLVRMMEHPYVDDPMNLGNPGEFTVRTLAEIVLRLTGSASPLTTLALPSDDPVRRCPDITRAKTYLGWEPTVALEEGLRRTIGYFRKTI